jgi:hypothetical protein
MNAVHNLGIARPSDEHHDYLLRVNTLGVGVVI